MRARWIVAAILVISPEPAALSKLPPDELAARHYKI
jgi:hypothetical protein